MVMHGSPALRDWLARCPLIAILRGIETSDVDDIFSELLSAGILIAEIPLNSPDPLASIRRAAELFSDEMLVGAGTVTKVSEVEAVRAAGAACKEIQVRLLAPAYESHTTSGRHEMVVEKWSAWSSRVNCTALSSGEEGRRMLAQAATKLGAPLDWLPWQTRSRRKLKA